MSLTPGDIVLVDDHHVGKEGGYTMRCLVVKVTDAHVHVRTERFPTLAEQARGDYDPWTKRVWRLKPEQIKVWRLKPEQIKSASI